MRWVTPDQPEMGAKRYRHGFLFLPKLIGNEWRWLEYAKWHETYACDWYGNQGEWEAIAWR